MDNNQMSGDGDQGKTKPNVKPQYEQKAVDQQGVPEKPERFGVPLRRSRSTDSERRGRHRERERERGERRERGRSVDGRHSDQRRKRDTTKHFEDYLDETECPVCFCSYDNVFKTPKLLPCGHTFCLECLARINVSSVEIKKLSCPVCRELTEIRHGRDLARLGNNEDVFRKLPPQMQQAQSVKFERSKGKLVLKSPTLASCLFKKSVQPVGAVEEGLSGATTVNVGRPPNRVRGRFGRMFQSGYYYYAVVISIVVIAIALIVVGILTFVVMPNIFYQKRP
ncbi:E3 ubiquitin-protein ligase RNF183 [Trichomycterus rosablanca]|uniref:E3 ubiquitin-protein ligase RNF183 n=1 Tax=Trichomycterus rosablanca TaxID=2290929 RepID=UPI002F35E20A